MTQPTSSRPDMTAEIAMPLLLIALLLVIGPIGLLAASLPWLVTWFLGRSSPAIWMLAGGILTLAGSFYSGFLWPSVELVIAALIPLPMGGDIPGRILAWLTRTVSPVAWPLVVPLGLMLGAITRLAYQDLANASPYRDTDRVPAPLVARIISRFNRHSSASWKEGTVLGLDVGSGARVILSDRDANHHVLTVGSTGGGKSVSVLNIVESHIDRGYPVIVLDGKGDVALGRQIKAYADICGRPGYIFHHQIDEQSDTDDSCAYNPFSTGDSSALADMVVTLRE